MAALSKNYTIFQEISLLFLLQKIHSSNNSVYYLEHSEEYEGYCRQERNEARLSSKKKDCKTCKVQQRIKATINERNLKESKESYFTNTMLPIKNRIVENGAIIVFGQKSHSFYAQIPKKGQIISLINSIIEFQLSIPYYMIEMIRLYLSVNNSNSLMLFHFSQCLNSTPHKKVKPNQDSTLEQSKPRESNKLSILQKLNNLSINRNNQHSTQAFQISEFDLPLQYRSSKSSERMDEEKEEIEGRVFALGRKMTYMAPEQSQESLGALNLYRSSSTFDQGRSIQQLNLGDNIYLRQLSTSQKKATQPKNLRGQHDMRSRIEQDYQIQQSLTIHKKRHQNFICLNKLQRVFYYVKKVLLSFQGQQSYQSVQKLTSAQVKIYNKDIDGNFLRHYQSWMEHNALYLTYEVAAESLEDCIVSHKRLKEVEVWDLIRDCSRALKWLNQQHESSHLNLKPGNILKCQKKFKLADPFLSIDILQANLKVQAQNWEGWNYLAPQIRQYYPLISGLDLRKNDIYALAMIIVENLLGERYFPREGRALRQYIQKHIHGYSPSLIRTLLRMLSLDPSKRPSTEQLCELGNPKQQSEKKRRRFSI